MNTHTRKDETALWQMYMFSGTKAIAQWPEADGITILQTAGGKEYPLPLFLDEGAVRQDLAALVEAGDTQVRYLVHVWKNHWPDVPAHDLCKALLELHPENGNAYLLLAGGENFVIRRLEDTVPPRN